MTHRNPYTYSFANSLSKAACADRFSASIPLEILKTTGIYTCALCVIYLTCVLLLMPRSVFKSHLKEQLSFKCETKLGGNCSLTAALIPFWLFSQLSHGESRYLDRDGYYSPFSSSSSSSPSWPSTKGAPSQRSLVSSS